jgi:hypothetical protein
MVKRKEPGSGNGRDPLPPMTPEEILTENIQFCLNARNLRTHSENIESIERYGAPVSSLKETLCQKQVEMLEAILKKNERATGHVFPVVADMEEFANLLSANPWMKPEERTKYQETWNTIVEPQALAWFIKTIREAITADREMWANSARKFPFSETARAEIEATIQAVTRK